MCVLAQVSAYKHADTTKLMHILHQLLSIIQAAVSIFEFTTFSGVIWYISIKHAFHLKNKNNNFQHLNCTFDKQSTMYDQATYLLFFKNKDYKLSYYSFE